MPVDAANLNESMIMDVLMMDPERIGHVLELMGVNHLSRRAGYWQCTCPIHKGHKPSFNVFFDRSAPLWQCWSDCASNGPIVTLPSRVFGTSVEDGVRWLASVLNVPIDAAQYYIPQATLDEFAQRRFEKQMAPATTGVEPQIFGSHMVPESRRFQHPLYLQRGIPQAMLDQFEVGFVPANAWTWFDKEANKHVGWFEDRISTPVRMQSGELIGFIGRRVDGRPERKWQTLHGTRRNCTMYGLSQPQTKQAIRATRTVIIVEGMADVWRLWQFGIFNVVSPFGTMMATSQRDLLAKFVLDKIVFMYDADTGGQTALTQMVKTVRNLANTVVAMLPSGSDPGDITDPAIVHHALANAGPHLKG
jgi:DNA primase